MESVARIRRKNFFACVSRSADTCENNLCSWQDFVIHGSILLEKQIIGFTLAAHHTSELKTLYSQHFPAKSDISGCSNGHVHCWKPFKRQGLFAW